MKLYRLLTTAAAAALLTSAAHAQTVEAEASVAADASVAAAPAAEAAAPAAEAAPAPAPAAPAYTPIAASGNLVETVKASGQFSTFAKALDKTNLTAVLENHSNLTVFAPTDAAFDALPAGELDRLMKTENAAELQSLLVYHIVNAPVDLAKVKGARGPVQTVAGAELLLDGTAEGGGLKANSANVLQANVRASNGILYVVNSVLNPQDPVIGQAKSEAAAEAAAAAAVDAANAAALGQGSETAPAS